MIYSDLALLFEKWAGEPVLFTEPLPAHGSDRRYFRLTGKTRRAIGAFNPDRKENLAFIKFSRHFWASGLPVPEIYGEDTERNIYLEQDLGDETLFSFMNRVRTDHRFPDEVLGIYRLVLKQLPRFQLEASRDLDFSVCYPRARFDRQSMMWDLNYFKYYFLKLAKIAFDEQALEDDFTTLVNYLLSTDMDYFLYRDFQSRNIMIVDHQPYFIDYQGGRRGALQYDLASLLYDAKADIPQAVREQLLEEYSALLQENYGIQATRFKQYYYGYVFIRLMQALGAYGFRGFYERKSHFLKSVPYAIQNLEWLLNTITLPVSLPALEKAWLGIVRSSFLRQLGDVHLNLNIRIQSFSYKRGIPLDDKGHGGGFVFDCRFLPNPGRLEAFKNLTGNDQLVIEYLEKEAEVSRFLEQVQTMMQEVVANYQARNFTDLLIAFGCTGGQHRSVYCASVVARFLEKSANVSVQLRHREQEVK